MDKLKLQPNNNQNTHLLDLRFDFGKKYLGPVIADYLFKLLVCANHFEQERNAQVFFVARAGIRIYRALEVFAQTAQQSLPNSAKFFWISRLMIAKGIWSSNRSLALRLLAKEFHYAPLRDLIAAMYRRESLPSNIDLQQSILDRPGQELENFLEEGSDIAKTLESYFQEQSQNFHDYLMSVLGKRDCALLVDTGWQGTAQNFLIESYPQVNWWGAYFGRMGFESSNRKHWRKLIGLVFQADRFNPAKPETCVVLHRHMIESLFEPKGLSIERMVRLPDGTIDIPEAKTVLADNPTKENDPIFAGVLDYLSELPHGCSPLQLTRASSEAWEEIARLVALPTKEEVAIFSDIERSADFGKSFKVPLVLPPKPARANETPEARIQRALWQPAQIALEYPPEIAEPLQRKFANLGRNDFKNGKKPSAKLAQPNSTISAEPKVAIITRTLDRPMFLQRALESVSKQTFKDYVHVVVNDGGDAEMAMRTIEETEQCDRSKVMLVDNVVNRGMEAASNIGIRACQSKYIVIHDDDDSWEPTFLEKTIDFLEGPQGQIYGGVITKSTYVSEEITPQGIVIHDTKPYQGWVETVHIMEMAVGNFYPPIAFMFPRDIYDKIEGFDERYPVLGDWDFNLRYLLEADIGVIPEYLANYHHRDRGDTSLFGNSVTAERHKHLDYSSIVRNKFARNLLHSENTAMTNLVGFGFHLGQQRDAIRKVENSLKRITPQQSSTNRQDDYWVAFQRLVKAIASQDEALFRQIGLSLSYEGSQVSLQRILEQLLQVVQREDDGHLESSPDFDEEEYLRLYKDVHQVKQKGEIMSGFEHYYKYGRQEGRQRPSK
jgi:glycosyltransferase involved in cell wall biosynthesis